MPKAHLFSFRNPFATALLQRTRQDMDIAELCCLLDQTIIPPKAVYAFYAFQTHSAPAAGSEEFRARDPTYYWKFVLRTVGILFAFISIIMTACALRTQIRPRLVGDGDGDDASNGRHAYGYYPATPDPYFLPWQFITLGLSFLWNTSCIIVLFVRKGRYMHPGASVACDLLLWMGLSVTAFFATVSGDNDIYDFTNWWAYDEGFENNPNYGTFPNGTWYHTSSNGTKIIDVSPCLPWADCGAESDYYSALHRIGVVVLVAVAFTCVLVLFHFALFISACRYTHRRRRQGGAPWALCKQDEEIEIKAAILAQQIVKQLGYPSPGRETFHMQKQQQLQPERVVEAQDQSIFPTAYHPSEIEALQPVKASDTEKSTRAPNGGGKYNSISQADENLPEINVDLDAGPPRY